MILWLISIYCNRVRCWLVSAAFLSAYPLVSGSCGVSSKWHLPSIIQAPRCGATVCRTHHCMDTEWGSHCDGNYVCAQNLVPASRTLLMDVICYFQQGTEKPSYTQSSLVYLIYYPASISAGTCSSC